MAADSPEKPHPQVVFTPLDSSQAALLHLDTKVYYSVNATGALIWRLLGEGATPEAIAERIAEQYEIESPEALRFVHEFLAELGDEGLLHRA